MKCENCGKNIKGDEHIEALRGLEQRGTIVVCENCRKKLTKDHVYECGTCHEHVALENLYSVREEGRRRGQICLSCVRYTLLWGTLNALIKEWTYQDFRPFKIDKKS